MNFIGVNKKICLSKNLLKLTIQRKYDEWLQYLYGFSKVTRKFTY